MRGATAARVMALAALAILASTLAAPAGAMQTLRGGMVAEDFSLKNLDGDSVRLSSFRGKVTLLNFWATWCATCRGEMPELARLQGIYKNRGFEVVAVALDTIPTEQVRDYVRDKGLNMVMLHDRDQITIGLYGVPGVPYTLLIDHKGQVKRRVEGGHDWRDAETRAAIESLLNAAARAAEGP